MTAAPPLGIAVLNWNNAADTIVCLESLVAADVASHAAVVVVDNGSSDGSAAKLEAWLDRADAVGWCQFLSLDHNTGYGAGNNVAIRALLGLDVGWIWVLNNDTSINAPDLGRLTTWLDSARAPGDVVGTRLHHPDSPADHDTIGGGRLSRSGARTVEQRPDDGRTATRRLDFIHGASLLVRREVFASCGLLPEHHFLFWEEMDFCARAREAGFSLGVIGDVTVVHRKGTTSGGGDALRQRTASAHFYAARANLLFLRRHRPRLVPIAVMARVAHAVLTAVKKRDWRSGAAVLRGVLAGLRDPLETPPAAPTS